MAAYSTGTVTVKSGSAKVTGNSTDFLTFVSAGNYFKIKGEAAFYDISSITNATNLTLSSRYSNTSYETSATESVASTNNATRIYSFTLTNNPVIQNQASITANTVSFLDQGDGTLTGTPTGSGVIDYDTGVVTLTFAATFAASQNILASYISGNTRNALNYQIVVDYTDNYNLPEMSLNDIGFQTIYTKAMRLIDSQMSAASINTATINSVYIKDIRLKVTPVSSDYSATNTDSIILVSGNTSDVTIYAPSSSIRNRGKLLKIYNSSASSVTLSATKYADTVDGNATRVLASQYDSIDILCATASLWAEM